MDSKLKTAMEAHFDALLYVEASKGTLRDALKDTLRDSATPYIRLRMKKLKPDATTESRTTFENRVMSCFEYEYCVLADVLLGSVEYALIKIFKTGLTISDESFNRIVDGVLDEINRRIVSGGDKILGSDGFVESIFCAAKGVEG